MNRRATAGTRGRRTRGGAGRRGSQAVSKRPPPRGPVGKRATGYLAAVADQGGGFGCRELPPDRGAFERQLAQPGLLRAHRSARLDSSDRGSLLDRMKRSTTRQAAWGKG